MHIECECGERAAYSSYSLNSPWATVTCFMLTEPLVQNGIKKKNNEKWNKAKSDFQFMPADYKFIMR